MSSEFGRFYTCTYSLVPSSRAQIKEWNKATRSAKESSRD
uniref:Uncharacterized protein n=1 Tax=Chenopodium quinoa TaxID=63459 RepID=A0A803N769_CHEQI